MKYITVGITSEEGKTDRQQRVAVCLGESVNLYLNEQGARKLVDDILRNANYLWPQEETNEPPVDNN